MKRVLVFCGILVVLLGATSALMAQGDRPEVLPESERIQTYAETCKTVLDDMLAKWSDQRTYTKRLERRVEDLTVKLALTEKMLQTLKGATP